MVQGGGESRGGDTRGTAVKRVLCSECRFRELRHYEVSPGSGVTAPADACMVNGQQRAHFHNPEGLCPKYEEADHLHFGRQLLLTFVGIVVVMGSAAALLIWAKFG